MRNISVMVIPKEHRHFLLVKCLFLCRQNNVYRTNRTENKRIVSSVRHQSFSSKYYILVGVELSLVRTSYVNMHCYVRLQIWESFDV